MKRHCQRLVLRSSMLLGIMLITGLFTPPAGRTVPVYPSLGQTGRAQYLRALQRLASFKRFRVREIVLFGQRGSAARTSYDLHVVTPNRFMMTTIGYGKVIERDGSLKKLSSEPRTVVQVGHIMCGDSSRILVCSHAPVPDMAMLVSDFLLLSPNVSSSGLEPSGLGIQHATYSATVGVVKTRTGLRPAAIVIIKGSGDPRGCPPFAGLGCGDPSPDPPETYTGELIIDAISGLPIRYQSSVSIEGRDAHGHWVWTTGPSQNVTFSHGGQWTIQLRRGTRMSCPPSWGEPPSWWCVKQP